MTNNISNVPILLVLYPYKMSEFLYNLHELPQFPPFCEVVLWDLSLLINPQFSKALAYERSTRSNVITISTWAGFLRHVSDLANISATRPVSIRHIFPTSATEILVTALVSLTFLRRGAKQFYMHTGGIPVLNNEIATANPNNTRGKTLITRFREFMTTVSSPFELKTRVSYSLYTNIARFFSGPITHQLAAGEHYVQEVLRFPNQRTKLVLGHSDDYSSYLRSLKHNPMHASHITDLAVMLDSNEPHSVGDYFQLRRPRPLTGANWFPAVMNFFDRL